MEVLARPFAHWNTICDTNEPSQITRFVDLLTCGNNIMNNYLSSDVEDNLDVDPVIERHPDLFFK